MIRLEQGTTLSTARQITFAVAGLFASYFKDRQFVRLDARLTDQTLVIRSRTEGYFTRSEEKKALDAFRCAVTKVAIDRGVTQIEVTRMAVTCIVDPDTEVCDFTEQVCDAANGLIPIFRAMQYALGVIALDDEESVPAAA